MGKFLIAIIVIILVLSQALFVIDEGELGLVLQVGEPRRVIRDPGIYVKIPLVQQLLVFEKRILPADARPAEYITLDKKRLVVDSVSRWKIAEPLLFYRTVRDYSGATARLFDIISGRLRQEIANHLFQDFIREKREAIMDKVTEGTREGAKKFGIDVVDVRIKRIDLPQEVQASVFARMRAERERIAKRYRAEGDEKARETRANADKEAQIILAEAYKQAQTLRGEGDAEATSIYAEAFSQDAEFYSFTKHLEVYENVFNPGTTILLRPDSDLLRFLNSPNPALPQK
jgi:membrane protease subunit HflC